MHISLPSGFISNLLISEKIGMIGNVLIRKINGVRGTLEKGTVCDSVIVKNVKTLSNS